MIIKYNILLLIIREKLCRIIIHESVMIIISNLLTILFILAGTKYYIYIIPEKTGETKSIL